jgi:hypothetical protein
MYGYHLLLRDSGRWDNMYECVLSWYGGNFPLWDFEPYGIIFINVLVVMTVAMV